MILSDITLKERISKGDIKITGGKHSIESASVDLTLGKSFALIQPDKFIEIGKKVDYTEIKYAPSDIILLPPKGFALATTNEAIKLPKDVGAFVTGRSSMGRMGLFVENAGWVDPGFEGEITLELFNATDFVMKLEINRRVAQLIFVQLDRECENAYKGKYQNQSGATPSLAHLDKEFVTKDNYSEEDDELWNW